MTDRSRKCMMLARLAVTFPLLPYQDVLLHPSVIVISRHVLSSHINDICTTYVTVNRISEPNLEHNEGCQTR